MSLPLAYNVLQLPAVGDSIRKYLANEYDFEKRKAIIKSPSGLSDAAWSTFDEMGLTAIALPEAAVGDDWVTDPELGLAFSIAKA